MNPAILSVLLEHTPELIAQIIKALKRWGDRDDPAILETILSASDALADQVIANAQAALNKPA
jgi:hypothetical protein